MTFKGALANPAAHPQHSWFWEKRELPSSTVHTVTIALWQKGRKLYSIHQPPQCPPSRTHLMRNILWLLCSHQLPSWMHSWILSGNLGQSREQRWDGARQPSGERRGCTEQRTGSQWNHRHLPWRPQGPGTNCLQCNRKTLWQLTVLGRH